MIDIGLSKMALIGAVALIVIGPEKLPRVARTVGALLGKAQRYVADVKAEVNRSMELDELRNIKTTVEDAAREVQQEMQSSAADFRKEWEEASALPLDDVAAAAGDDARRGTFVHQQQRPLVRKNWRLKRGALPQWYKMRTGVRTKVQSGAARVARFRPRKFY